MAHEILNSTGKHPPGRLLKVFRTLEDLSDEQLDLLSVSLKIKTAAPGTRLIARGASKAYSFLLLSGDIRLVAADGGGKVISAGTDSARNPIAQLLPRRFEVTAVTPVAYLEVDAQLLEELRENSELQRSHSSMLVEHEEDRWDPASGPSLPQQDLLLERLREDLEADKVVLPSLPDIAFRIGRALNDEVTDADRIAAILQSDLAITAKIVKAANSALYAGHKRVDSCAAAVVRLGVTTTHKLVLSFALREIFSSRDARLNQRMEALWRHSTRVGAICYVLARLTRRFNPEHAMLAGLIHDIGNAAVYSYATRLPELAHDAIQIQRAEEVLRGELGAMILKKWHFSDDFILAAREAEHWSRNPAPEADYCDLVIIAQLHSFVGTPRMAELPHMGELPCFQKLDLGELTPRLSLKILEKAKTQLEHAEHLLGI